ncbi:MAG: hypothetical protein KDD62_15110, partial [Bdellovibrionales bacterium]|nr:hypothetical protein [Bdellovibrionales bacterium]
MASIQPEKNQGANRAVFQNSLLDSALLNQINNVQRELGQTGRFLVLPEVPKDVMAALKDKRILMLDDSAEVLATWSPALITATNGYFSYLHITERFNVDLIRQAVVKLKPDLILVDYDFGRNGFLGTDLITVFRAMDSQSLAVGFSSSEQSNEQFRKSGVLFTADKANERAGLEQLKLAAEGRDRQILERILGSVLLQAMDERFDASGGREIYKDALADL